MTAGIAPMDRLGAAAWAALFALQMVWHAWLFPPGRLPLWLVLAVALLPLLLPLLALPRLRRALLWVGTLALFYFCHGVTESWSAPDQRWLGLLEIAFSLVIIGALGLGTGAKGPRRRVSRT